MLDGGRIGEMVISEVLKFVIDLTVLWFAVVFTVNVELLLWFWFWFSTMVLVIFGEVVDVGGFVGVVVIVVEDVEDGGARRCG